MNKKNQSIERVKALLQSRPCINNNYTRLHKVFSEKKTALFGLLTGTGGRLELFQLLGPDQIVEKLPEEIQPDREAQADDEEHDTLRQVQNVQHRIDPDSAVVADDVQPRQVARHEDAQSGQAGLARWILPEAGADLQDHEDHDVGVHHMVQPTVDKNRRILIRILLKTKKSY